MVWQAVLAVPRQDGAGVCKWWCLVWQMTRVCVQRQSVDRPAKRCVAPGRVLMLTARWSALGYVVFCLSSSGSMVFSVLRVKTKAMYQCHSSFEAITLVSLCMSQNLVTSLHSNV
jgi:hypothetical protein